MVASDNFTFSAVAVGITRAECIAFFVSPRNSPLAIANLLAKTNSKYLLATKELIPVVNAVFDNMETSGMEKPKFAMMPVFPQLFNHDEFEFLPRLKRTTIGDVAIIIHSSGKLYCLLYYQKSQSCRIMQVVRLFLNLFRGLISC
jgi:hypothetical protein